MFHPRELSLSDRNLVNDFFANYPPEISEHTFTNLYVWRHSRPIWLVEVRGSLLFLVEPQYWMGTKKVLLGPPIGPLGVAEILAEFRDQIGGATRLPVDLGHDLETTTHKLSTDRDNFDYVYKVSDLAELKGRNYMKKRNHIKRFHKQYDYIFEEINTINLAECLDIQHKWCEDRECELEAGLFGEYQAIQDIFKNYQNFKDLIGAAIRVNGHISAFTIGERLNSNTAVCHFEKALPGIHGLGQVINQMFAENCLKEFIYVNREQDLGIKGLRRAKESYHPDHMIEKCIFF